MAGDTGDAERRFEAARELAAVRGYRYLSPGQVAALPRDELLARVEAVPVRDDKPDKVEAAAILDGVSEPPIKVSRALDLYWTLTGDETMGKSEVQVRRWKNPRKKAVANFIAVVGDKNLADISGDDMLDFRQWWIEKLDSEELTPNSANKDLIHLGSVLKTINKRKRLGLVLPLTDLSFKEGEKGQRPPFSVDWIKTKLLAPGALDGLNTEARCIVLGIGAARNAAFSRQGIDPGGGGAQPSCQRLGGHGPVVQDASQLFYFFQLMGGDHASIPSVKRIPEGKPNLGISIFSVGGDMSRLRAPPRSPRAGEGPP